ncbi:hypothetical protein GCM10009867_25520 [Pedococcus aerophilus]|uniref:GNAT family N-acetyltransferase n=1 Tax=Pedococcus aerophilus TaxID=436356 RepID=A0ABN3URX7_9MICO
MTPVDTVLRTPAASELTDLAEVLAGWQVDDGQVQLHPGDLGWYSMRGADATAEALRIWSRDGGPLAMGLLDGEDLLRLALDPEVRDDVALARQVCADVVDPGRGVLSAGSAVVESRGAVALQQALRGEGWVPDEPWTPLCRNLSESS